MDELIQKILANILPAIANTSLSERYCEAVLKRLVSFGYALKERDGWMVCFAMQKTENRIKNSCNISAISDGLFHVAVDMACGEFLLAKKQTGTLEIAQLDLNRAVTQIREGDTTVQFANGTSDEEKLNTFLNHLLHSGESELVCYRKLSW